ncbi:MAG: hypothetical protein IKA49_06015 [Alistipes sp.]|nr:hypothetical protein [Alistipes sp.]
MRRFLSILTCAMSVLSLASCNNGISDEVQPVSLNATTQGFVGGDSSSLATWTAGEKVALLSSEDWSAATLSVTSGAGSTQAVLSGDSRGSARYYAVRPAAALLSVDAGIINFEVEPNNIVLGGEDTTNTLVQLGVGDKNGLSFSNLFGAAHIAVSGNFKVNDITVTSETKGVSGTYAFNTASGQTTAIESVAKVSRSFEEPLSITSSATDIFVALPAGNGISVEIQLMDRVNNVNYVYSASSLNIEGGKVTTITTPAETLPVAIGDWHLVSYCGKEADVDLYLSLAKDKSFTLYQRSGSLDYSKFTGEWSYNPQSKQLSGRYSDGSSWAASYYVELTDSDELKMTNVQNATEVSLYERTEMPTVKPSASRSAVYVKPLL